MVNQQQYPQGQMPPQQQVPIQNMHAAQSQMPGQQMQMPQQQPAPPTIPQGWTGDPSGGGNQLRFKDLAPNTMVLGTLVRARFCDGVYQNHYKGRQVEVGVQVEQGPQNLVGQTFSIYLSGRKYDDFLALRINIGDGWGFNFIGMAKTKAGNETPSVGQLCEKRTQLEPIQDPEFGKTAQQYLAEQMGMAAPMQQQVPQQQMQQPAQQPYQPPQQPVAPQQPPQQPMTQPMMQMQNPPPQAQNGQQMAPQQQQQPAQQVQQPAVNIPALLPPNGGNQNVQQPQ